VPEIGLSLPPFSFVPCSDGFIVDCKGHHLTILFDETRISAHLTRNSDGEKLGRAQVSLQELHDLSDYFVYHLLSQIKKVRISDLFRRGYWISYDRDSSFEGILRAHSPLKKKKFRPNLSAIAQGFKNPEHLERIFHRPNILGSSELRTDVPIFGHAPKRKGREKQPDLAFFYAAFPGHEGWYCFNARKFIDSAKHGLLPIFVQKFGEFGRLVSQKMELEKSLDEAIESLKGHPT
jgi:hypothetical protein